MTSPRIPSKSQRDTQLEEWEEVLPSPPMRSSLTVWAPGETWLLAERYPRTFTWTSRAVSQKLVGFQSSSLKDCVFTGETVGRLIVFAERFVVDLFPYPCTSLVCVCSSAASVFRLKGHTPFLCWVLFLRIFSVTSRCGLMLRRGVEMMDVGLSARILTLMLWNSTTRWQMWTIQPNCLEFVWVLILYIIFVLLGNNPSV